MDQPEPLSPLRLVITSVLVVLMAAVGYLAVVVAAFALYPTCVATAPPGPPSFLLACAAITFVCGFVPLLGVGLHRRRAAVVTFCLGAVVPLGLTIYVASRTGHGFCF